LRSPVHGFLGGAVFASPRLPIVILVLSATFALPAGRAFAETLTGTLTNGTTHKPAAGDEVILIKLAQGMEEAGHTKADARGAFHFTLDDAKAPHLIRAIHQGVTYHRMAPPGTTSVEVPVYDVAKKIEGVSVTADVMRFQAQGKQLQGIRLFAVNNASDPPRTQAGDQTFEFYLPSGAEIDQTMAMTANGQPINSPSIPEKEKNRFAFNFPLRPGETQFQVVYHLPYNGQLTIDPKALYPAQHFVVMLPKAMQFAASAGAAFQPMQDPRQSDAIVEVISKTEAGQPLGFKISGTGTLAEAKEDAEGAPSPVGGDQASAPPDSTARPGGGLGPPSDAPDPLEKYRWYILGGFGLVLSAGAVYIASRSKTATAPDLGSEAEFGDFARPARAAISDSSSKLLEALKEELFQLEVEHKQGSISQQEYEKARTALDQTLERAVKRASMKTS
jgi:hypothetical protein